MDKVVPLLIATNNFITIVDICMKKVKDVANRAEAIRQAIAQDV